MTVRSPARAEAAAPPAVPPSAGDDALKARIANALWTEIHWLMPADRKVLIDVDGDDIAVSIVPAADRRPGPH